MTGATFAAPPQSLTSLSGKASLTENDEKRIEDFSKYWLARLETGIPEDVTRARNKLIEPLNSMLGKTSSIFRSTYSDDLLPTLEKVVEGDDAFRAVNALQVIGFIGTDPSTRLLTKAMDPESQEMAEKRLWATIAIRESLGNGDLSPRRSSAVIREIGRSASTEPNWQVLMRQLETLAEVTRSKIPREQGGDEIRKLGRSLQVEVMGVTIDRLLLVDGNGDKASIELIHALRPSILEIQRQYLDPEMLDYRHEIGINAAPQLGRVYEIILVHFDALRGSEDLRNTSGLTLRLSEETLKLIDSDVRSGGTPNVNSMAAWEKGRKEDLQRSKAAWGDILKNPPYSDR